MDLTESQIEEIIGVLHEKIQFYDHRGAKANDQVTDLIEIVLRMNFTDQSDAMEQKQDYGIT